MADYYPVLIYFFLVLIFSLLILGVSSLFPANKTTPEKYTPYESGNKTKTALMSERFQLHHYLTALMFLVFDIEVIFFYPWAVIGKAIGSFAFYEMLFFIIILLVGFTYVWRKGGLQWE